MVRFKTLGRWYDGKIKQVKDVYMAGSFEVEQRVVVEEKGSCGDEAGFVSTPR